MKRPDTRQGEDPFDKLLSLDYSLLQLWQSGEPFSDLSSRREMRYHKYGNLLLRANWGQFNYKDAQQSINVAEGHLQRLRKLGMHVVSHLSEVYESSLVRDKSDAPFTVISASKYITKARVLNRRKAVEAAPRQIIHQQVLKPLGLYLDWAETTEPTYLLDDIYKPSQYAWQESSDVVFLHDIDPLLTPNKPGVPDELANIAVKAFRRIVPLAPLYF